MPGRTPGWPDKQVDPPYKLAAREAGRQAFLTGGTTGRTSSLLVSIAAVASAQAAGVARRKMVV